MHFAPDTEDTLEFTVALVNTVAGATRSGLDELETADQLAEFLRVQQFSGRIDHDAAELADVLDTRARLRRLWTLDRDEAAVEVNAMLRAAGALPYLMRHDGFDWHLHATEPDAPLAERIRVEVALAIVDVIRTGETGRLRACGAGDCDGILVDLSRNGSKRFCSVRCGNRMNMVAFRERAAGLPDPGGEPAENEGMGQDIGSVDEYIAGFPPEVQEILQQVRAAIHRGAPDAPEKIRYSIAAVMIDPAYAIHFAGWKKHVGVYPVPRFGGELDDEIAPYRAAKDSANFRYDRPIPYDLIERVAAAIVARRAPG